MSDRHEPFRRPHVPGRRIALSLSAMLLSTLAGRALAGYADDRAEIENLSNRYMIAVDAGDIDTVMSTWAEDGELDWVGGVEHGRDAIRKAMSGFGHVLRGNIPENATTRQRTHHQIINHVIDVDGDRATTIAYWFAITNETPQQDVQLLFFGHYEDELVRRNGRWLFSRRRIYNESKHNKAFVYPRLGEKDPRTK